MTDDQYLMITDLLTEIRDAVLALNEPIDVVESNECLHPDEARISLATPSHPTHWICHLCRYEHRSGVAN